MTWGVWILVLVSAAIAGITYWLISEGEKTLKQKDKHDRH